MQQDKAGSELNLALRDNLTLINKGFVQSLCLRLHDSKERAQLAYGDNLAATRQLMQLLQEMQHLGIPLDPDGASGGTDRGHLDLQSGAKDIWISDLRLATRKLEALKNGRASLHDLMPQELEKSSLGKLIEEGEAFVAELKNRRDGRENLGQFDPTNVASEAEQSSLEDFLDYAEGTDGAYLDGKISTSRSEGDPIFAVLTTVLHNYFLAIDQYFLHGFLMQAWQENALAAERIKHSVEAMRGAYRVAQRILVLGSVPQPDSLPELRLRYRVDLGSGPLEAVRKDLELTSGVLDNLRRAKDLMQGFDEPHSVEMLELVIDREVNAKESLSHQLDVLSAGESGANGNGEFDAMLDRWSAT